MRLTAAELSEIRYGYGFRPGVAPAGGAEGLLAGLGRKDPFLEKPRIASLEARLAYRKAQTLAAKARRQKAADAKEQLADALRMRNEIALKDYREMFRRPVVTKSPFRERLVAFWADHFTVALQIARDIPLTLDFIQTAIRPHVSGSFPEMLEAVVTHPAMLLFLSQAASVGPNSQAGQARGRGLNENLAREILELHTLGVDGAYSQGDVRQFAELLTGLTVSQTGFHFVPKMAEPGAEEVLGQIYGAERDGLPEIKRALRDISQRADTARHIARKLHTHFIGGVPDAGHLAAMEAAYRGAEGRLMPVYEALLDHPDAFVPELRKVKQPYEFIVSALRAVGLRNAHFSRFGLGDYRRYFVSPMTSMGQPLFRPNGPDGWSEDPADWVNPAALAARITWGNALAVRYARHSDPRTFLKAALRGAHSDGLRLAVSRAESKHEGIAITLASPEFNRR